MSAWNFMSYESKANLLEAVRRESAGMFELAADPGAWTVVTPPSVGEPSACGGASLFFTRVFANVPRVITR